MFKVSDIVYLNPSIARPMFDMGMERAIVEGIEKKGEVEYIQLYWENDGARESWPEDLFVLV